MENVSKIAYQIFYCPEVQTIVDSNFSGPYFPLSPLPSPTLTDVLFTDPKAVFQNKLSWLWYDSILELHVALPGIPKEKSVTAITANSKYDKNRCRIWLKMLDKRCRGFFPDFSRGMRENSGK